MTARDDKDRSTPISALSIEEMQTQHFSHSNIANKVITYFPYTLKLKDQNFFFFFYIYLKNVMNHSFINDITFVESHTTPEIANLAGYLRDLLTLVQIIFLMECSLRHREMQITEVYLQQNGEYG